MENKQNSSVVGRIMPPHKDVHVSILRVCKYMTMHGKGDLAAVIKGTDLVKGRLP
jgi:hypothetical protein